MSDSKSRTPLTWESAANEPISEELSEHNTTVLEEIKRLLKAGKHERIRKTLRHWTPPAKLDLLVHLPLKRARVIFEWIGVNQSKVLAELNPIFARALRHDETIQRLIELIDDLELLDAAHLLDDLPDDVANRVLTALPERDEIAEHRGEAFGSASSIMSRRFAAMPPDWTVERATAKLRANARSIEKLYAVYVVDKDRRPLGYLRLRDLLLSAPERPIGELMHTDFVAVDANIDQEEVLRIAKRRELSVVPVVDTNGRLIGRIDHKQLRRVYYDEAEEDINLMSGLSATSRPDDSVERIVRGRMPWLLTGLLGASLSAVVVGSFEEQLAEAAILAVFIPIVMSMAGNAGIQSSTVAVQGLSAGTIDVGDIGLRVLKELLAALSNGLIVALVLGAMVLGAAHFISFAAPALLAGVAGLALLSVVVVAVLVGATVPILLDHLGIDPALATGVFITTGNDILSVSIFFTLVTLLYL